MSDAKKPTQDTTKTDQELSDLLDSALDDFSKQDEKKAEDEAVVAAAATTEKKEEGGWAASFSDESKKQAAEQFERQMAAMFGPDAQLTPEQFEEGLHKLAEAASQVVTPEQLTDAREAFSATISQTLQEMSQNSEAVPNNPPSHEEMLVSLFTKPGDPNHDVVLPIVQDMLQTLLSKDLLYPSLKDILNKFPQWLEENKDKISADDLERYLKQQELMEAICEKFENPEETDTEDKIRDQIHKVMFLMQKLQECGQPPVELVGEVPPGWPGISMEEMPAFDPNVCVLS